MRAELFVRLLLGTAVFTCSAAVLAENAFTNDPASVRAGPDDSYPEVAQIDGGTPIQVEGCLDDWSWCDVAFDGNRGWLYAPDISYEYQGGYVPFYSYAPALGIAVVPFSLDVYWGRYYHDRPWYGQRVEWEHRQIHHRIPAGPPPSHSPPPREVVRNDRPHPGGRGGQPNSLRLGSAEPAHPDANRPGSAGHEHEPRPPDAHPPQHMAPPSPRPNSRPPEPKPAEHPDVPRPDEHHAPPERAKAPPARDERDDHPH